MIPIKDINPTYTKPIVTVALIILNVIVFMYQIALGISGGPAAGDRFVFRNGVIPYELRHHVELSPRVTYVTRYDFLRGWRREPRVELVKTPIREAGEAVRLLYLPIVFSIFVHGGAFHLGFNMLFLWIFGNNVEDAMGHGRYLAFYLICGIAASLVHIVTNLNSQIPTIGASGAIAGVMGAYIVLHPHARVLTLVPLFFYFTLIELPAYIFLGLWFFLQLLMAGGGGGVAWFAHIGGFIAGLFLVRKFVRYSPRSAGCYGWPDG